MPEPIERLTLSAALSAGRLADFIVQAEADGIGQTTQAEFDEAVRRVATKPPRSVGRTSRSAVRDDLTGK
jgi:hypothetical protein